MKEWLWGLLIQNWQKKVLSIVLATIIWILLDQSLTTTRTFNGVVVRIINIPEGKTVEGLQNNQTLNKRISVTVTGKKTLLDDLTVADFEVVIDAQGQEQEWVQTISKKNLVPLNNELNFSSGIDRATSSGVIIKLTKLAQEKIPVYISCIGEAPKPYFFLDVVPPRLTITIQGPQDIVKRYKQKGATLIVQLSDIPKSALEALSSGHGSSNSDVVSFAVPEELKVVSLPLLSNQPLKIDDPQAASLEINFLKNELIPVTFAIPYSIYIPPDYQPIVQPQKLSLAIGGAVRLENGLKVLAFSGGIYASGVSPLFIETIRNMVEIQVVLPARFQTGSELAWSYQLINPTLLEERYVLAMLASADEEIKNLSPRVKEELMRHRFRTYMNRLRLCDSQGHPLELTASLKGDAIQITQKNSVSESSVAHFSLR